MTSMLAIVGRLAFLVGVLFAIFGGIWGGNSLPTNEWVIAILLIAGVLIGFLNITAKEAPAVLLSAVALIILGIWGSEQAHYIIYPLSATLADNIVGIVCAFALLMAPAAIIITVKTVIATAKPGD